MSQAPCTLQTRNLMHPKNRELFPLKDDFRIVSLGEDDVRKQSDHFNSFRRLVLESEEMYPKIGSWLTEKVFPELPSSTRTAWVGYESGRPAVTAVLKTGSRSKFCHLRVSESIQDLHLGELFFTLMALGSNKAQEIHFTLPESLWETEKRFFQSFGFLEATVAGTQYRGKQRELLCTAPAGIVLSRSIQKIPKLVAGFRVAGADLTPQLLMSIKPRFAEAIMSGQKKVEVRRRFSEKWEGATVGVYSTRPQASLLGRVLISKVIRSNPSFIWKEYGAAMGCSHEEYLGYVGESKEAVAIVIDEPRPFLSPVPMSQIEYWLKDSPVPPQSYCLVDSEDNWGKALALASLFNGRFSVSANRAPHESTAVERPQPATSKIASQALLSL